VTLRQSASSHYFVTFVNLISQYQVYLDVTVGNAMLEPVTWSFCTDTDISPYSNIWRCAQTSNTPCPHTSWKVHWYWRWNFKKCIVLGKLCQHCHLNILISNFGAVQWNSSISETVRNRNDRCYDLPDYWPFLPRHSVYYLNAMFIIFVGFLEK
jgi:hypothetical protein